MGIGTAKALQARRREAAAHIERLIAQADERSPIGSARRARIRDESRLARRRIKALAAAQQAVSAIEVEIGQALIRITDQGLSRNEAFELASLSRHLGRRYVELAMGAQSKVPADPSTPDAHDIGLVPTDIDPDPISTRSAAETPGRKL